MGTLLALNSGLFLIGMGVAYWHVRRVEREVRALRDRNYRLGIQSRLYRDRVKWSEDRVRALKGDRIYKRSLI